jgi:myosin heavy subunit
MAIRDTVGKVRDKANQAIDTGKRVGKQGYDTIKPVYDATKPFRSKSNSIIAASKGNLFEFPVFISSSVQLDYATATSSLLEQLYASYVQVALSLNPVVDHTLVANGTPFAQYQSSVNRYVEYTDMDYAHDAVHNEITTEDGSVLEFNMMSIEDADGRVILEQYNKRPLSEFDHFFQEAQRPGPNASNDDWADYLDDLQAELAEKNAKLNEKAERIDNEEKELRKKERDLASEVKLRGLSEDLKDEREALKKKNKQLEGQKRALENEKQQFEIDKKEYEETKRHNKKIEKESKRHNKADEDLKRKQLKHQIVKDRHDQKQHEKERKEDWERDLNFKYAIKQPELLDETKLKKLNTMKPLMMNVSFNVRAEDGQISRPINYVIGVKTFNRVIDADILPEVAQYPLKEMDKIGRKVKWRAGELKFFRDIVFKIKQKKQTAVDSRDPKRKWYRRLYELAHTAGDAPSQAVLKGKSIAWSVVKSQVDQSFNYGVIPNASLIISASDVSNIKAKTKIDLLKGSTATKFCKELFLISLVVIDTDAESIKILRPDEHSDYEVHSLASVNKQLAELSTAGSKTRDIFKLLG